MKNLDFIENIYNYLKYPKVEIIRDYDFDHQIEIENIYFNDFELLQNYENELNKQFKDFRIKIDNFFQDLLSVTQNKDRLYNYLIDFESLSKLFKNYQENNVEYYTLDNLIITYNGEDYEKINHSNSKISTFLKLNYDFFLKLYNKLKIKIEDAKKQIIKTEQHILFLQYLFNEINLNFDENIYKLIYNNNLIEARPFFEQIENNKDKLKTQENLLSLSLIVNQLKLTKLQEKIFLDLQNVIKFDDKFKKELKNALKLPTNKEKFKNSINIEFCNINFFLIPKNSDEHVYQLILYMIFRQIFETSELFLEDANCKGRADIVLKSKEFIYIFEIKVDKTNFENICKEALQQINVKFYAKKYDFDERKIIKSAIVFNTDERQIEEIEFVEHKKLI